MLIDSIEEFYLTESTVIIIVEKYLDISMIENKMTMIKKLMEIILVILRFGKMKQYLEALRYCFENGTDVDSRAGKVRKSFGYQMHYDLSDGFPAITTKKLAWKSVVSELLLGSNDERRLAEILYDDVRENLKIKKQFGLRMLKQITGNQKQNLRVMLVKYMVFNGEILMEKISYQI